MKLYELIEDNPFYGKKGTKILKNIYDRLPKNHQNKFKEYIKTKDKPLSDDNLVDVLEDYIKKMDRFKVVYEVARPQPVRDVYGFIGADPFDDQPVPEVNLDYDDYDEDLEQEEHGEDDDSPWVRL